jgi:hypothetical protein
MQFVPKAIGVARRLGHLGRQQQLSGRWGFIMWIPLEILLKAYVSRFFRWLFLWIILAVLIHIRRVRSRLRPAHEAQRNYGDTSTKIGAI